MRVARERWDDAGGVTADFFLMPLLALARMARTNQVLLYSPGRRTYRNAPLASEPGAPMINIEPWTEGTDMTLRTFKARPFAALLFLALVSAGALAQPPGVVTAADYARAEKFLPSNLDRLVYGAVRAEWIGETDDFWYRRNEPGKVDFVLVDAATGAEQPAFDQARLAAALGKLSGRTLDSNQLPFQQIEFSWDMHSVSFAIGPRHFECDRSGATCTSESPVKADELHNQALSPDGKRAVFIRDWNLWLCDVATGRQTQLTHDGAENFGYATDNAGWSTSDRPVVLWSPDSKKVATFQQDQRNVGDMYLVETRVGHPILHEWKYPLPGDKVVTTIQRVIVDVDSGKVVRLKMPPDQHRSTLCATLGRRGVGARLHHLGFRLLLARPQG
jgi:dipeptidyl-peptidase 4